MPLALEEFEPKFLKWIQLLKHLLIDFVFVFSSHYSIVVDFFPFFSESN